MNCGLIGNQQRASEKVSFGLNPAIASTLAAFSERRRARMAKKTMRQLMANIAALTVLVVRVVMYDRRPPPTGHGYR
jgi:hypothetical protein